MINQNNHSIKKLRIISILFCLFLSLLLYSEGTELRPYRLINADKLIVRKVDEDYITNLIGNVHFFYGETEFFSDKADLFEQQKMTRLWGNVEVYDDTLSLFADKVDYFRETEKLFLKGDVFVKEVHQDSTVRTFEAERVEYFRIERELFANDNVRSFDERENLHGECGKLSYYMNDGYGYLMKEPVLKRVGEDSLQISAQKIEYLENYEKIIATFDVVTESNEFKITSDFLLYFSKEEKAIYLGEPKFYSDFGDASAVEFQIFFKEQKIETAILRDSCWVYFATEENAEKKSWITSNLMEFHFDMGSIKFCDAQGHVDSYFHQEKTDKRDLAINKATGDRLIITISEDNKIETIDMRQQVHGMYKFHKK